MKIVKHVVPLLSISILLVAASTHSSFSQHFDVGATEDGGWGVNSRDMHMINGDWIIAQPIWLNNTTLSLYGNLTVTSSGALTMHNVTLWLNSSYDGQYSINVEAGGRFFMSDNDNNRYTRSDASALNSSGYNYLFVAEQDSVISAINSEVHKCGSGDRQPINSGPVVSANGSVIQGCLFSRNYDGLIISASHCSLDNNTIADNSRYGLYLYMASNNSVFFNNISRNIKGICVSDSKDNRIEYNNCSDNYETGIFLNATGNCLAHNILTSNENGLQLHTAHFNTVTDTEFENNMCGVVADCYSTLNPILNSTIASSVGNDDVIACDGSVIDLINTTFDPLKISCDPSSAIRIWNFLNIFVVDLIDRPLCGVTVSINQNSTEIYNLSTDSAGSVRLLLVQHAFYNRSSIPIINITSVHVFYRNLSFGNNPRVVDMSLGHSEIFRYCYVLPYILEEKNASPMIIYAKGEELQPQECRVTITLRGKGNVTKETGVNSGTNVYMIDTLPPYIHYVPGTFSNSTVKIQNNSDSTTTLTWNPGTLRINDTWSVEYNITSTLGGKDVSIGTNYCCVNYTMWNATNFSLPFLNPKITVVLIQKNLIPLSPVNQEATVNSSIYIEVLVVNKTGIPVEGVRVNFSIVLVPSGSIGQNISGNVETSFSGVVNATFHLGTKTGLYSIRARCQGADNELIFNVSAVPDALSHIQITPSSFKIVVGSERIFYAEGFDRYDNQIDALVFNWNVIGGIGTIANGLFKAGHVGTGFVQAWNCSIFGSAEVEVLPDTYMPRIISYTPQGENIPLSSEIVMIFNESMNRSVTETAVSIEPWTEGKFSWNEDCEMQFIPTENLTPATLYRIRLNSSRASDLNGNRLDGNENGTFDGIADDIVWEFITVDTIQPYILDYSPLPGYDIDVKTIISLVFSEPMNIGSTENSFKVTDRDGKIIDGTFRWLDAATKLEFLPEFQLIDKMEYKVTIRASATDLSGNALDGNRNGKADGSADDFTWSFTVGLKTPDTEPNRTNLLIAEGVLIFVLVLILFLVRVKWVKFWKKKKDKKRKMIAEKEKEKTGKGERG